MDGFKFSWLHISAKSYCDRRQLDTNIFYMRNSFVVSVLNKHYEYVQINQSLKNLITSKIKMDTTVINKLVI